MPSRKSDGKPVFDAVNDAVSALSDLVRSLRQTAKRARKEAKGKARVVKVQSGKVATAAKRRARELKVALKSRIRKAWGAIRHAGDGPAGTLAPKARAAESRRRASSKA